MCLLLAGTLFAANCVSCSLVEEQDQGAHECCPATIPEQQSQQQDPEEAENCVHDHPVPELVSKVDHHPTLTLEIGSANSAEPGTSLIGPAGVALEASPPIHSPPRIYLLSSCLLI